MCQVKNEARIYRSYILEIKLREDVKLLIGKLGLLGFKRGSYFYVGSGKKNLLSRISRHLKKDKKRFWHIDYFLSSDKVFIKNVWISSKRECALSYSFFKRGFSYIENFGSSDCKCQSHLFFSKNRLSELKKVLEELNLRKLNISDAYSRN
ncbi:MAG: GIY-YIG nuclease family protein [Candidatus Omnitrophica bacterium]|nr:GIY-YIG nuclease family protein [Candidatus Omnitrophota bacterium]